MCECPRYPKHVDCNGSAALATVDSLPNTVCAGDEAIPEQQAVSRTSLTVRTVADSLSAETRDGFSPGLSPTFGRL